MQVGGEQRPGVDDQVTGIGQASEAVDEVVAIAVIVEDGAAFDATRNDVVEGIRSIESWAARHEDYPQEDHYTSCHVSYK